VLLVAAGFAVLCLREASLDAPTYDEPVYVSAGVLAVLHHDLTFNDEHPPLPKVLAALPVLAAHPIVPPGWQGANEWDYSPRFVEAQLRAGKLRLVTFLSRLVPILEAIAVGLALYLLGSMLHSPPAGAIAAVLWLANPVTIGLGHLDGADLPVALAAVLVSLALLRWLRRRDRGSVALVGLACGGAASVGPTGLLLAALAMVVVVASGWRGEAGQGWRALVPGAQVAVITVVFVWFVYAALDPGVLLKPSLVLPHPYLAGLHGLAIHDTLSQPAYLFGVRWYGRRIWYWPGTLLVKTPIPTLLVLIIGPFAWWAASREARREVTLVAVLPALVLAAFIIFGPQDSGVRYLLPVIALWLVVASAIVELTRWIAGSAALAAIGTAALIMSATSFPHSTSWTTPPFTPGYAYASNSSIDWGQDYFLLVRWSQRHHPYVAFFGSRALRTAIPGTHPLLAANPHRIVGWVAVSATMLTTMDPADLSWLNNYCPVATIGGSILIYRFEHPPNVATGPPMRPAAVCAGEYSRLVRPASLAAAPVGVWPVKPGTVSRQG
jgi:hypothetical protein